jgi:hypothetical protein
MTGPLSILSALATLFVDQQWQRGVFVVLAIVCLLIASYSVWKEERAARVPEAALQIDYDQKTCLKITEPKYLFSVLVSSINTFDPIRGVIVSLEEVDGLEKFGHLNRPISFKYPYESWGSVTCNPGEKIPVNILFFDRSVQNARLRLVFQRSDQGNDQVPLGQGTYVIKLRATGGGAQPDFKRYEIGLRDGTPFMEPVSS